jgi:ketosteroid isomerase-like protein
LFDATPRRGVEAVRRTFREWLTSFAEATFEWEKMIDAGDEVVTLGRWRGAGKASGAPADFQLIQVWTFRDEKVVRCRAFATKAEALEAAGVSE